ncbi:L,D-transpeptidase family protein [Ruegeria aquimaris]
MASTFRLRFRPLMAATVLASALVFWPVSGAMAQVTAYKQALAEASYGDEAIGAFYRQNRYQPVWTGEGELFRARRAALIEALSLAEIHGLPAARYDVDGLRAKMTAARTVRDMGLLEVEMSRVFARFAGDIQSGFLTPSKIDEGMVRVVERRGAQEYLSEMQAGDPGRYLRGLAPATSQYRALLKLKLGLEQDLARGGWGPTVPGGKLSPGDTGTRVVQLRNRLIAMGYMDRSAAASYDGTLQKAVQAFQVAHGLEPDGVAGDATLEEINRSVADRLKSVIVALERERWLPRDRGERHILVNQTDFTAKIVDHGRVTFETRSVIGMNTSDRRSPEFSDEMEHMVINPSWYVPRSIITKEYLPKLRANPNAVRHLEITDSRGRQVNRDALDFSQFSTRSFPFAMRQPPGKGNALGLVKFMFPNKYNIYLHDTPQKHLFAREVRAFSHGCIRLAQPFEFAYALLAAQEADPESFFHGVLNTGRETKVELTRHVPVHIIYRTAYVDDRGAPGYRRDVYGRDAKIWDAMSRAGVVLSAVQG